MATAPTAFYNAADVNAMIERAPFTGSEQTLAKLHAHLRALVDTPAPDNMPEPLPLRSIPGRPALPATTPAVICLTGYPRTGKDVLADYIQIAYRGSERIAFSDAIIIETNPYLASEPLLAHHHIHIGNKSYLPYRQLLQLIGDVRREVDEQHWSNILHKAIMDMQAQPDTSHVTVTGARKPSEIDFVRALPGGVVGRVKRPGNQYVADAPIEHALDHIPDEDFDFVLLNDREGNLAHYVRQIEADFGRGEPYSSRAHALLARLLGRINWRITWGTERRIRRAISLMS